MEYKPPEKGKSCQDGKVCINELDAGKHSREGVGFCKLDLIDKTNDSQGQHKENKIENGLVEFFHENSLGLTREAIFEDQKTISDEKRKASHHEAREGNTKESKANAKTHE